MTAAPSLFEAPEPSIRLITQAVAEATGVSAHDIRTQRRTREVMEPRHMVCWLAARLTTKTYGQIGTALGGRDHTTIRSAALKLDARMRTDAQLSGRLTTLLATLQALAAKGLAERCPDADGLAVAAHIIAAPMPERAAIGASTDQIVTMAAQLMALHRAADAAATLLVALGDGVAGAPRDHLAEALGALGYVTLQAPESPDGQ